MRCFLSVFVISCLGNDAGQQVVVCEQSTVPTIKSVEYEIQKTNPPSLTVKATGEVKSLGFSEPKLTRTKHPKPPADGIQDYSLTAKPPVEPTGQALSEVSAEDTWPNYEKDAPWLRGIRIKGVGAGEKLVWIKADVNLKPGGKALKAKVGQIVEVQVQYAVAPPFPSDFKVEIGGKEISHSESQAPVLIGGVPVVGSSLICIRFPVTQKGSQKAMIQYQHGGPAKIEVKLEVAE